MKLDFIKQIMSEFDQSNVTKMKVEIDDLKIELEKESEKVEYVKPLEKENKMVAEVNTKESTGTPVKSPIVGVSMVQVHLKVIRMLLLERQLKKEILFVLLKQ